MPILKKSDFRAPNYRHLWKNHFQNAIVITDCINFLFRNDRTGKEVNLINQNILSNLTA